MTAFWLYNRQTLAQTNAAVIQSKWAIITLDVQHICVSSFDSIRRTIYIFIGVLFNGQMVGVQCITTNRYYSGSANQPNNNIVKVYVSLINYETYCRLCCGALRGSLVLTSEDAKICQKRIYGSYIVFRKYLFYFFIYFRYDCVMHLCPLLGQRQLLAQTLCNFRQ